MSDYVADLQALLNAADRAEFLPLWLAFQRQHYPEHHHIDAFVDCAALLRSQIPKERWWMLLLRFCEIRLAISQGRNAEPDALYDYNLVMQRLAQPLGLSRQEILDGTRALCAACAPEERWQFDRLLNEYLWAIRDKATLLQRQEAFLADGRLDSLYCVDFRACDMLAQASTDPGPGIALGPARRPALWQLCAWDVDCDRDNRAVRLDAPFCFDTNHLEGAGLFSLLASCDLSLLPGGAPSLHGASLRIAVEQRLDKPGRILLGISAMEQAADSGRPSGRSAYCLLERPISSPAGEDIVLTLNAGEPHWRDMGRNPYSAPYRKYCRIDTETVLAQPHGLFLMLMQDGDRHPKQGSVIIGDIVLIPSAG